MISPIYENELGFHTRRCDSGNSDLCPRFHNSFELYFQLEGKRHYLLGDGTEFILTSPSALLLRPAVTHSYYSPSDQPYRTAVVGFERERITDNVALPADTVLDRPIAAQLFKIPTRMGLEFAADMERIWNKTGAEFREIMIAARLAETICELSFLEPVQQAGQVRDICEEKIVVETLDYIEKNLGSRMMIAQAAANTGYTPNGLSALLKRYTGCTWREQVSQRRCMTALRLLADPNGGEIWSIAERCGFESENYFGDYIRAKIGVSPREYRRRFLGAVSWNEIPPMFDRFRSSSPKHPQP